MNIDDLIIKYGLTIGRRFTRKEKNFFCNEIGKDFQAQGYSVRGAIGKKKRTRGMNLMIGNVGKAKTIFVAHYDTLNHDFGNPIRYFPLDGNASFSSSFLPMNTPAILSMVLGLILLLGLGRKINFQDNLAMSVLILGVLIALVVVSFMMTFRIGNKVNLNRNTSGVVTAYLIAQQLPEKLRDKVAFVLTDGGNGTHVGDYMLRDALPNTIKDRNVIILDCVGKGPRLGIGYFEASKANAEKLEAIVKAKDPEAKLHTSLVDEDHVKYTSLSFYEKGMIVCRGKNLNGSLIVENTATNHDDEVEREKIEALAADLTELAKQIS